MKFITILSAALLLAGCSSHQHGDIEVSGTAKGINFGNISIRDLTNNGILYKADIEAEKFDLGKKYLQYAGYYKLVFSSGTKAAEKNEIYLEPGTYTISIDAKNMDAYPIITSTSEIQKELSAYNAILDSVNAEARKKVVALNGQMNAADNKVYKLGQASSDFDKLQRDELKANETDFLQVFTIFMNKYPKNQIAAHLMIKLDYQGDPVAYNKLYERFSDEAKNSDEGKELGTKLKKLTRLAPGAPAPAIAGNTSDGRSLDIKSLGKKVLLLDFWRSGNETSHADHQKMLAQLLPQLAGKGFGIVSVSFDTDQDKWLKAVKNEGLGWPQISDLKGDDSPNIDAWGVTSLPAYCLLDGNGNIIERDVPFNSISADVTEYLKKHP